MIFAKALISGVLFVIASGCIVKATPDAPKSDALVPPSADARTTRETFDLGPRQTAAYVRAAFSELSLKVIDETVDELGGSVVATAADGRQVRADLQRIGDFQTRLTLQSKLNAFSHDALIQTLRHRISVGPSTRKIAGA